MNIDWLFLAGAMAVLWIPSTALVPATAREWLEGSHNTRFRIERLLVTWQHWLDLLRAFWGTFVLTRMAVVPDPGAINGRHLHYAVIGIVLLIAVALQTVHRKRMFYFTAPVFFIWGVTFGLVNWVPVLFAIVFSAILTRMLDHVDVKFPLMAVLVGIVDYFYSGFSVSLALACVLIVTPLVLAYASMNTMTCYSRTVAAGS